MWLKDTVALPLFVKKELFFEHHVWDILIRLSSSGEGGEGEEARRVGSGGTERTHPQPSIRNRSSVRGVAKVTFSSRFVRPHAIMRSPGMEQRRPGSRPASVLIVPLIREKSPSPCGLQLPPQ